MHLEYKSDYMNHLFCQRYCVAQIYGYRLSHRLRNLKQHIMSSNEHCWQFQGNLPNFLWVPPTILGTGKATDFKFGGYIYRDNPNKSLLKISKKRDRGRIRGVPKFFGYPLLSQERVKLRTSNFVGTFIESIRTKAHENCWE